MNKLVRLYGQHKTFFNVTGLGILFYFIFFHNIGNYALMDVDETRYVSMARDMFQTKDFMTLYLNGEYFFEKPPLYFWSECFFFTLFGKVCEYSARFGVALYGALTAFLVYFTGRKLVDEKFGVLSSLILATSLEFLILAKFAILDIVVSTCIGFALCFGILTLFTKKKKFLWWLFYTFSGLAVMAKGIPGFVIPFGSIFLAYCFAGKVKELFKPSYFAVGFTIFTLIVIPWHMLMFNIHYPMFYDEYIYKHHIQRFLGQGEINRTQPVYFYVLTILWGFFPWIFSFVAAIVAKIKSIKTYNFNDLINKQKVLYINSIIALFILLFFSTSSTKLVTYILPIYVPLAFINGYIWSNYDKFKRFIDVSSYILGGILLFASFVALFMKFYLPHVLYMDILEAKWLCIILLAVVGLVAIISTKKHKPYVTFFTYVVLMLVLSAFGTKIFYNIDYKFGQNELMEFAKYAKEHNYKLSAVDMPRKYSLIYYSEGHVNYIDEQQIVNRLKYSDEIIIVKKKDIDKYLVDTHYNIIMEGRRYILICGRSK